MPPSSLKMKFPRRTLPRAANISKVGLTGHYEGTNHHGKAVVLETTKQLAPVKLSTSLLMFSQLRVLQKWSRLRRERQRSGFIKPNKKVRR
jgi:hypothetical protein